MTNYPTLTKDKNNCSILKSSLVALQSDKANALFGHAPNSKEVTEVIDKIKEYNTLYSGLSCEQYLSNKERGQYNTDSDKEQAAALEMQKKAFEIVNKGNKPDNTKNVVIYGVVGLIAIAFTIVLIKKM